MKSALRIIPVALLLSVVGTVAAVPAPAGRAALVGSTAAAPAPPTHRPRYQGCSSNGSPSFVGISPANTPNFAATGSGVAAGYSNAACDPNDFIGAGQSNGTGGDGGASYASIGAGLSNAITDAPSAFVGGGVFNAAAGFPQMGGNSSNDAVIAGGESNTVYETDSGIVAGDGNQISSQASQQAPYPNTQDFIGAGLQNGIATNDAGIVAGFQNRIGSNYSFVGGGEYNKVWGGYADAAVAGASNYARGGLSLVGAGEANQANGEASAIGAGYSNKTAAYGAFIGAGYTNGVTGVDSFVGAGRSDIVNGVEAFIGAGQGSSVTGELAAIPGGNFNVAAGYASFAGGVRSEAFNDGAFVWSDDGGSTSANLRSSNKDQFLVRSSGGVVFYTDPRLTCGMLLQPGANTWTPVGKACASTGAGADADIDSVTMAALTARHQALVARVAALESQLDAIATHSLGR